MSRNAGLSLSSARPPALATRAAWRMVRAEESVTDHVREEHEGTQATHARGACHSTSSFSRAERLSQRSRAPAPVHILIGVARCRCPQSELRPTRNTIGPRPKPFNTCKKRRKIGSETARHLCSSGRGPRSTVASAPPPCARPSTGEPEAPSIRGRAQLPAVAPLLAAPAAALGGGGDDHALTRGGGNIEASLRAVPAPRAWGSPRIHTCAPTVSCRRARTRLCAARGCAQGRGAYERRVRAGAPLERDAAARLRFCACALRAGVIAGVGTTHSTSFGPLQRRIQKRTSRQRRDAPSMQQSAVRSSCAQRARAIARAAAPRAASGLRRTARRMRRAAAAVARGPRRVHHASVYDSPRACCHRLHRSSPCPPVSDDAMQVGTLTAASPPACILPCVAHASVRATMQVGTR